jgi:hypothetical protein
VGAFNIGLGHGFCVVRSRISREVWVSDFAWAGRLVLAWGLGKQRGFEPEMVRGESESLRVHLAESPRIVLFRRHVGSHGATNAMIL